MEAVIFRNEFFCMAPLYPRFRSRLLTAAIMYRCCKQAAELSTYERPFIVLTPKLIGVGVGVGIGVG